MAKPWSKVSMTIHDMGLDEPVYTVAEASTYTGCSVQALNRLCRGKVFEPKYVCYNNRQYKYYTQNQLDEFMRSDVFLDMPMNANRDLLGSKIGKLIVMDFSDKAKEKGYYGSYVCKCDCGNVIVATRAELLRGNCNSCGCRYYDLTGQRFGRWVVLRHAGKHVSPNGDTTLQYLCKCDCGTERVVLAQSLLNGTSQSCGCYKNEHGMSKYELCVMYYLENHGFSELESYWKHKTFPSLVGLKGRPLSYDFYLHTTNGDVVIECQGGQHYFPVDLWGGIEAFESQVEHDNRKKQYAEDHNMTLIEIPYTAYFNSSIVDILDRYSLVPNSPSLNR